MLVGGFSGSKAAVSSEAGPDTNEVTITDMERISEEVKRLIRRSIGYDTCENLASAYG